MVVRWQRYASIVVTILAASVSVAAVRDAANGDYVVRWSSTGGGWRAMFACIGYVNVFYQAGILNEESTILSSIATNSGASWFSTQLFYSKAFFDQTVTVSPDHLYNFTLTWMDSYNELLSGMLDRDPNEVTNTTNLETGNKTEDDNEQNTVKTLKEFYDVLRFVNGDWAEFIRLMMGAATEAYGHEGNFTKLMSSPSTRLAPFANTDLLIQAALSPTARIRNASSSGEKGDSQEDDIGIYLGPMTKNNLESNQFDAKVLYSVAISVAYVVNATWSGFLYNTLDSDSGTDVATFASPLRSSHSFNDWANYHLWPVNYSNATATIAASDVAESKGVGSMISGGPMPRPFGGGEASLIQVSAISSAAAAVVSPLVPSPFTHAFSQQRGAVEESKGKLGLAAYDAAVNSIYASALVDDASVCAQWPKPCSFADGRFLDGGFVDNPSVAINIAQYHQQAGSDLQKTMKLILTNTNQEFDCPFVKSQLLQYFATDFNKGIEPGEYLWLDGFSIPSRSNQVFSEFLDEAGLNALLEPIEDSNMTTAILKGTTIDNPANGVIAGQSVEILLLNLNEPITTFIAGPTIIDQTTLPLANMVKHISSSGELVTRVQAFIEGTKTAGNAGSAVASDGSESSKTSSGTRPIGSRETGIYTNLSLVKFFLVNVGLLFCFYY